MLNLRKFKIRTQLIILLTASSPPLFSDSTTGFWLRLNRAKAEFTSFIQQEQRFCSTQPS